MAASSGKPKKTHNPTSPTEMSDAVSSDSTAKVPFLDDLLNNPTTVSQNRGITVGTFCGWSEDGAPLVEFAHNSRQSAISALSTVALGKADIGQEVALLFEDNSSRCPIVIGLIQPLATELTATLDDQEVVLEARERIELRCGKAKIVLMKDGRILIKGTDLVSRSEGPNRLKGASIQIN